MGLFLYNLLIRLVEHLIVPMMNELANVQQFSRASRLKAGLIYKITFLDKEVVKINYDMMLGMLLKGVI